MTESGAALAGLLAESVRLWRVPARVDGAEDIIRVTGLGIRADIVRAGPELPYRWMMTVRTGDNPARSRPALSVVSVLRQVRLAFDPGYAKERLRIASPPLLLPNSNRAGRPS